MARAQSLPVPAGIPKTLAAFPDQIRPSGGQPTRVRLLPRRAEPVAAPVFVLEHCGWGVVFRRMRDLRRGAPARERLGQPTLNSTRTLSISQSRLCLLSCNEIRQGCSLLLEGAQRPPRHCGRTSWEQACRRKPAGSNVRESVRGLDNRLGAGFCMSSIPSACSLV